jgi:hypothetical protein
VDSEADTTRPLLALNKSFAKAVSYMSFFFYNSKRKQLMKEKTENVPKKFFQQNYLFFNPVTASNYKMVRTCRFKMFSGYSLKLNTSLKSHI